jgi:hypothetical protein
MKNAVTASKNWLVNLYLMNPCIRNLLEEKNKGIRGVGEVAQKEAYTVHTTHITSQSQYLYSSLISYFSNASGSHSAYVCVPFTRKQVT